jgi:chromosomal replication initiation ATPase DnaA
MADRPPPSIAAVQRVAAMQFDVPLLSMSGQARGRAPIALARQVAMALASELTGRSLAVVARHFNRDHTTVINARKVVALQRVRDPELDRKARQISAALLADPAAPPPDMQLAFLDGPLFDLAAA